MTRRLPSRQLRLQQLEHRVVLAAAPVISEFLAANAGGLEDEDGDSSDWVEIYNPGSMPIDLAGWSLTDDSSDLTRWNFPSTVLGPADSLIVFASGKDRAIANSELHTNFSLSSSGEYLALVDPSGDIANHFEPEYPSQFSNVSYGMEYASENFVQSGDTAKLFVPVDDSLGTTWRDPGFDDSGWADRDLGVGFGVIDPGFDVRYVKAQSSGTFNGVVNSLAIAETVLATPAYQSLSVTERTDVINYLGTGGGGQFGMDHPFPTQTIGENIDHFVIEATATIQVPTAGEWSFGVNSDDGFGLTLNRDGVEYTSSFPNPRGPSDTIETFDLPSAGSYEVRLVMFEAAGGASVELFAAPGAHAGFSNAFDLVGDVTAGGLPAFAPYIAGQSTWVSTDIQTDLLGVNSSAFLRVPFDVNDTSSIESLTLRMRHDDGFVAYLNGVEVARHNAPATTLFDSSALSAREPQDVIEPLEFVLDASLLATGPNTLAIQGLNVSANDASFLIHPELSGTTLVSSTPSYFRTPTPGALNQDPVLGVLQRVSIDVPAGFYETTQTVSILSPDAVAEIYYTTDGSEPSAATGTLYTGPLSIANTTTLRAVAIAPDYVSLPSVTRTFLFLDDVLTQSPDGSAPPGWPSSWGNNVVDYGIDPEVISLEGASQVKAALLALPSISVTTALENLFDPATGIYSNAQQDGRDWERPASAEWLNPNGEDGFQVNAGLRIRGGFSRSGNNPKHAFKLFFRGVYGDSTLNYPVHGDAGVSEFHKLDLRTAQNYSWSFQGSSSNNFIAEVLARYNQRDLGQPYTRSTWVHLYLNGQYWGLYQTQERAEAYFAASYFGGEREQYDVLKPERGAYQNIATDGNFDAYFDLWSQANARSPDGITPAFVDDAAYLRAQGKNPDGSDNLDYPVLLDVDNLIAYMLETFRGGNLDAPISNFLGNDQPNNYFAIRNRDGREGFRFFQHDGEHTMRNVNENRNGPWNAANFESGVFYFNPQWLHQQLMANTEYRIQFADTVQRAFFHDGPLSETALLNKIDQETALIETAVIAESARWGDAKRGDNSPFGQSHFLNAIAGLKNNYIPNRNGIVLDQFRNTNLVLKDSEGTYNVVVPAPLFPSIDAPAFLIDGSPQHGGIIESDSALGFVSPGGTVYYMIDGSDPRLTGGGIHPEALAYESSQSTIVAAGSVWQFDDTGTDLGTSWRDLAYDASGWSAGNAELGYGDGDETTVVSFGGDANNKQRTTYFRHEFNLDTSGVQGVSLRVKRDDGVVVYLNGTEVARSNMPGGPISYGTPASAVASDDGNNWHEFTIPANLLQSGTNVLAAEVHQISATSSDISFDAQLIIETPASPPLILNDTTTIKARAQSSSGEWSALSEALFRIPNTPASPDNVRVTEIHYHPAGNEDAEFIEITNTTSGASSVIVDLDGVTITDGPSLPYFVPAGTRVLPGESILIVRDPTAFATTYPTVDASQIVGPYEGKLSNGGERIQIVDTQGAEILDLDYTDADPWPKWADGVGGSLELVDLNISAEETGKPYHYRGSLEPGGSPGQIGDAPSGIVINEVLAHTDDPLSDAIELFNPTGGDVDISGWFVSDDGDTPQKYRFPGGTVIPAGGYWVIDEAQFNPTAANADSLVPFGLSSQGDSVWLFSGDGVSVTGFQDHVAFDATFGGVSLGLIEGSAGRLVPLANRSLGELNGTFVTSDVILSEVNYHPETPSAAAIAIDPTIDSGGLEFIELAHASSVSVDLDNWRLRGEASYDFPMGLRLDPGQVLVVASFDPANPVNANRLAAFRVHYGIDADVNIVGPFAGGLSNSHGIIKLQAPDDPPAENPTFIPRVTVDEVFYDDLAPWDTDADGFGPSLQRVAASTLGNYFDSWRGETPTPGVISRRPLVESIQINSGSTTRSQVTQLTVTFDLPVGVTEESFLIRDRETNTLLESLEIASRVIDGQTVVDITFGDGPLVASRAAGNSLVDGTYELTVRSDAVATLEGNVAMASDFRFGELATDQFFRYFGDSDGDRDVDGQDFGRFGTALFSSSADSNYDPLFDFDGDGDVDGQDYGPFTARFLTSIGH
ncbi:MAG: lamin tail domain-containing protein [Planctomycetota bacterium]